MRSVESTALKAATEPAIDHGLLEARRSAEETIKLMREKYEGAGARIESLSATIRPTGTAIRSDVTMDHAAAERLFGKSAAAQRRHHAGMSQLSAWRGRAAHAGLREDSGDDLLRQFAEGLADGFRPLSLPSWMREVIRLDNDNRSDAALDELFDQIDILLSSGEFSKVDSIIAAMPVEGPSLTLMMGLLSITRPACEHLPSRVRYFERVHRLCNAMRRDAESLLGGLR